MQFSWEFYTLLSLSLFLSHFIYSRRARSGCSKANCAFHLLIFMSFQIKRSEKKKHNVKEDLVLNILYGKGCSTNWQHFIHLSVNLASVSNFQIDYLHLVAPEKLQFCRNGIIIQFNSPSVQYNSVDIWTFYTANWNSNESRKKIERKELAKKKIEDTKNENERLNVIEWIKCIGAKCILFTNRLKFLKRKEKIWKKANSAKKRIN